MPTTAPAAGEANTELATDVDHIKAGDDHILTNLQGPVPLASRA
ncbi:hypothetical protein [Streptomyces inhibens]|nr:hypothetical protein [Streptomyces inhibens]